MHIAPHDNANQAIVDADDPTVPLNYFNIVKLKAGEAFNYQVPGYETCIVPATGSVTVEVEGETYADFGGRGVDVWDGEPQGVYIPSGAKATIVALTDTETFIAGAKYDKVLVPFFSTKKEGSGIGLSWSNQIVHLHKGTLTVASQPGEYAQFTLEF